MATSQLPFQGATAATIFEGLLTKQPAAPSAIKAGLPAEFDRVVLKALEKDRDTRYQGAAELRADLKRLKRALETGSASVAVPASTAAASMPKRSAWRKPALIGAPLVAAAILAVLAFYQSPATPALTQQDTVVLSSVVNRTGDTMFDDTLGEALALQLRQSPFLNLVPEQQVQATLRLMGRDPMTPVTSEIGREVCQRTGATALLGGTIAMLGSSYVVTLNAQDCVGGKVIAEEQAQAATKESVLSAMGTAVTAFREKLGESLASIQRYDSKIEEATTTSLEALKAYSQGLRTRRTTGDFDSVPLFRRAIDLDPDFALAYARLGTVYSNLNQQDEAKNMTTRAFELREKVSEVERLYIEARYYSTVTNDLQKAIDTYNVWLATYPNDYTALVNSALLHKNRGERDEAIRKLELASKVAPDQPLAWTNLGQTYFEAGKYADAKRVMETAVKLQDSTGARVGIYQAAVMLGEFEYAEQQVAAVRGRRDEIDMVAIRMFAATYLGKFKEANALAGDLQARAIALSRPANAGNALMQVAISEAAVGLVDAARQRVMKAEADGLLGPDLTDDQMVVAAIVQDARRAKVLLPQAVEAQKKSATAENPNPEGPKAMQALALLAEGKPADAAAAMEPVAFRGQLSDVVSIWTIAKLRAEDWASAAKGFDYLVGPDARPGFSATVPFMWAMRGRVYSRLGQNEEARKSYQKFFDIWKNADPDIPLLVQAREEFAKLGS
jgi:tetratricopeptide (TPR) repeat protein